jgi:hypothetical protein
MEQNIFNYSTASFGEKEAVIKKVGESVHTAFRHYGYVFGEGVRELLMPPEKDDPSTHICYYTEDLWFKTVTDAETFVKAMGSALKHMDYIVPHSYPGTVIPYYLVKDGQYVARINVIICSKLDLLIKMDIDNEKLQNEILVLRYNFRELLMK